LIHHDIRIDPFLLDPTLVDKKYQKRYINIIVSLVATKHHK